MLILNKRVRNDYEILKEYEFGLVLKTETLKQMCKGEFALSGAYGWVRQGELWLKASTQEIKLLAHKKEIKKITTELTIKRLSLMPLKIYQKHKIKIQMAICRPLKKWDKKELLKKKDHLRDQRFMG